MKKSILIISQYFWPEKFHINDVSTELQKLGHQVQVLTGQPNYPKGKLFSKYKKNKTLIENFKNIPIYRVPIIPRKNSTTLDLIKNYISFIYYGIFVGLKFNLKKFDKIFFYGTSPITSVIPAIILKLFYKKKLIVWVQDLWPQSLTATGYIYNKFILKLVNLLVIIIYFYCDKILIQSKNFKKYILTQTSKKKIIYHPNSFKKPKKKIKLKTQHFKLLKKNFCITFAGNIGKAQNLENLLLAAKNLSKYKKLKIIIIGEGSDKKRLVSILRKKKIQNVHFLGSLNQDYVFEIYKHSKALYVSLKNNEVLNLTIPYKIQSYLSAEKLIIGSASGITKKIIISKKLGFCCDNNNLNELQKIIKKVIGLNKTQLKLIEKNSKNFYDKNFNFSVITKKLSKILNENT